MDERLLNAWNETVGASDTIYYLGDLLFGDAKAARRLLMRLHGQIKVVPGNHDRWTAPGERYHSYDGEVEILPPLLTLRYASDGEERRLVLCHYPLEEWDDYYRGALHLCGHVHATRPNVPGRLDVGADVFGRPVALSELPRLITPVRLLT